MIWLEWKLIVLKEKAKASFYMIYRKTNNFRFRWFLCNIKMHQKRHICNFRKYRPISFECAILLHNWKPWMFRIDRTGSDVIMATESFSYIIHCNFEIEYLWNAKWYRDDIWCDNMICLVEAFCGSLVAKVTWTGSDAKASIFLQGAVESLFLILFWWNKRH